MTPSAARWPTLGLILLALGGWLARAISPNVTRTHHVLHGPAGLRIPALQLTPPHPTGDALLVHGITASKESMLCLAEALAEAGYRSLTIDLPGHGRSPHGFERPLLLTSVVHAAQHLDPEGQLDLYVGHSLGANLGQHAVRARRVHPRAFVALGAYPDLAPDVAPDRVLALTGAHDLLCPPAQLRALARDQPHPPELVVSPTSDHVLEPFDPALIEHVRALASNHPPSRSRAWWLRLLGIALCALAYPLLTSNLGGPEPQTPRRDSARGLLASTLALLCAACALGPGWIDLWPNPRMIPVWLAGTIGVASAVAALRRLTRTSAATFRLGIVLAIPPCAAALALWGPPFLALLAYLGGLGALGATALSAWVERRAGHLAANVCFGVTVSYAPALWLPVLL